MLDKEFYIKNGLIYGAITIAYLMISYAMGIDFMVGMINTVIGFIIPIGILVYIGLEVRKASGGFVKFADNFKSLFLVFALGAFLLMLFNHILNTVIDPDLPYKMYEQVIENTMSMMEGFGTPEEALDATMVAFEEGREKVSENFTALGFVMTYLTSLIMGIIYSLIAAAITKKNNPNPLDAVQN